MAEIVNLRRARKARQKAADAAAANVNRARHGQTKAERTATEAEADRRQHLLDGAALDRPVVEGDGEPRE